MKKYYLTAKLLFITTILSLCFKPQHSKASTLLFISEDVATSLPVKLEFQNRIKLYKNTSVEEIIKSKSRENNFLIVLEPNRDRYNHQTRIKLMTLPIASMSPVNKSEAGQLVARFSNSLNKLSWNGNQELNRNSLQHSTILILPQTGYEDIYRNIYDFEISLIEHTNSQSSEKLLDSTQTELNKLPTVNNPRKEQFDIPNNLSYPSTEVSGQTVSTPNNINNFLSLSLHNQVLTEHNRNLNATQDIAQYASDIQLPLKNHFNPAKTKEQEELERKLEQQRKQLEKQQEQLYKQLEKQRQQRQRKREQEARMLQQKRQQQIRQAQQIQERLQQEMQQSLYR